MRSGNTAPRKTIMIFDHIPMPNQMIKSGNQISRGVAFRAET